VEKIRAVEGRIWHPEGKYWSVPDVEGMVETLLDLFRGEDVDVVPTLAYRGVLRTLDDELKLRGYSPRTRKAYKLHIGRFLRQVKKSPQDITPE